MLSFIGFLMKFNKYQILILLKAIILTSLISPKKLNLFVKFLKLQVGPILLCLKY